MVPPSGFAAAPRRWARRIPDTKMRARNPGAGAHCRDHPDDFVGARPARATGCGCGWLAACSVGAVCRLGRWPPSPGHGCGCGAPRRHRAAAAAGAPSGVRPSGGRSARIGVGPGAVRGGERRCCRGRRPPTRHSEIAALHLPSGVRALSRVPTRRSSPWSWSSSVRTDTRTSRPSASAHGSTATGLPGQT